MVSILLHAISLGLGHVVVCLYIPGKVMMPDSSNPSTLRISSVTVSNPDILYISAIPKCFLFIFPESAIVTRNSEVCNVCQMVPIVPNLMPKYETVPTKMCSSRGMFCELKCVQS